MELTRGDLFKGKSVKSDGYTHIVFGCRVNDKGEKDEAGRWAVWIYGGNRADGRFVKKVEYETFVKAVEHGDLEHIGNVTDPDIASKFDVQRLSMLSITLSALGAGQSPEEYLEKTAEGYMQEDRPGMDFLSEMVKTRKGEDYE